LEGGLKLNLNRLIRQRIIVPGYAFARPRCISWRSSYTGDEIASAEITFDLQGTERGWLNLDLGYIKQHIRLHAHARHFGGQQWYFVCPYMNRDVSVLWRPPGARSFGCRQR